jgi:hypothetical protein
VTRPTVSALLLIFSIQRSNNLIVFVFFSQSTGAQVSIGVDPSKVQITKLHMDPDRKKLLERKSKVSAEKGKGKYSEADVNMANVD